VTLTVARIVRAEVAKQAVAVPVPARAPETPARIVPAQIVDAAERANQILAAAETRAREIVSAAEAAASALARRAVEEGRAAAVAGLAERALRLSRLEAEHDQRATNRLIELARLLAERLLGVALRLEPSQVVALAEHALGEARGARRITIVAHPDDTAELERALAEGRLERVTRVIASGERGRGSLRLETEIGVLDADLAPQLGRLAEALRASLHHES
jgi:flagellar biosynthesis/type III secretory pathway protein FliH